MKMRRREFIHSAVAGLTGAGLAGSSTPMLHAASSAETASPAGVAMPAHPFLTSAHDFADVSRGNPNPQTLRGEALVQARLTSETWRLEIVADEEPKDYVKEKASIERPLTLDLPALEELGKKHGVKFIKAMQCLNIPTPLGQGLWEGVPLRDVLQLCGHMSNVRRIFYWGFHNDDPAQMFRSSLSYSQVMETPPGELPVFIAYRLNGDALPLERGGPVRMIVPWAHGFKSIKWLQRIVLTNDYKANDTYAEKNNDPESHLKTAAYLDELPKQFSAGEVVPLSGLAIAGWSGLKGVEYWVRPITDPPANLPDDDPAWQSAHWGECELSPPPRDWSSILPTGVSAKEVLGFDPQSGQPLTWPLRYSMVSWSAAIRGLAPGSYEVRARAVDLNGFAQPEPRPLLKSGKNGIQVRRFQVM